MCICMVVLYANAYGINPTGIVTCLVVSMVRGRLLYVVILMVLGMVLDVVLGMVPGMIVGRGA